MLVLYLVGIKECKRSWAKSSFTCSPSFDISPPVHYNIACIYLKVQFHKQQQEAKGKFAGENMSQETDK